MTDINQLVEVGARAIAPRRWEVMDSYLEQNKRKYAGQNVGWPTDQFKDKESMAQFRAGLLAILPLLADDLAGLAEAHSKARYNARDNAKARKANQEARDNESMAIEGIHIAQAIRTRIAAIIEGEGK